MCMILPQLEGRLHTESVYGSQNRRCTGGPSSRHVSKHGSLRERRSATTKQKQPRGCGGSRWGMREMDGGTESEGLLNFAGEVV